jgi:UDP-2-acetamido-3-amino-2,3-dideoxy-glucuronate N-acetyltransferase
MEVNLSIYIHPTAVVDEGAKIGSGTKIWHFCHISPKTEIGDQCSFGQNVFIANNVKIGKGAKVQNNVSIYEGVEMEDYVFCGPSMVFTNVKTPRSEFPVSSTDVYSKTLIKRGASIGANATVVCGITLGTACFIAAGAVVTKDVPDFAVMAGVPAKRIGWMCKCGGQLFFETKTTSCEKCNRFYEQKNLDQIKIIGE